MDRSVRSRNKTNNSLRMKASSLYFLNDISNIDSTDSNNTTNNWRDDYTFNPMIIGRGHFSKVYKVKCCSTGNTLAIKVVRRRRLGTDKIEEILREIEIMQILNKSSNSGFIQLVKVHTSPSEVGIVMEFASGGALFHVTQDSRTGLPEVYAKIILTKVLSALSVLHHQGIVHLDIKADNILLRYPYPSTDVALSDFGLTRKLTKSKVYKEIIGTPDYIAPEVVNYEEICVNSDMWSVGVLAYFILTNVSPFTGISKEDTLHKVTKTQYEFLGKLKEESMCMARYFISSLLVKIPENRLTVDQCLSHEFLSNVNIIECSQEKSTCLEAPVINLEYDVKVRPNPSFRMRGMVMSQYDIDSSDMMHSEEDILNCHSVEALEKNDSCHQFQLKEELCKGMEVSIHSIDKIDEGGDEKELEIDKDNIIKCDEEMHNLEKCQTLKYNYVDCPINNNNDDVIREDESLENDVIREHESLGNDVIREQESLENDVKYNGDSFNTVVINSSVSEITSNKDTMKNQKEADNITDDIYLLEDENCKENNEQDNCFTNNSVNKNFQRTEVYDSRRRCNENGMQKRSTEKNSQINESFRNSRENIIEKRQKEKVEKGIKLLRMNSYNTIDSQDHRTDTLRSTNGGVRRRTLSRSIKKDSDKPHNTKWNRRSEVISCMDFSDGLRCTSERNNTLSNTNLNTSANKHKRKYYFSKFFTKKRTKESTKEKSFCIIS